MDAAEHWDDVASSWLARPGFGPKKMLTATGITGPNGKVFAALLRGRLMLKLPAERVDELETSLDGERLRAKGKSPMREWITIGAEHHERWPELVDEAHRFVG